MLHKSANTLAFREIKTGGDLSLFTCVLLSSRPWNTKLSAISQVERNGVYHFKCSTTTADELGRDGDQMMGQSRELWATSAFLVSASDFLERGKLMREMDGKESPLKIQNFVI